jgi:hypothetical protein
LILEFCYGGPSLEADLVVAVGCADGKIRFLPHLDEFAVPLLCGIELSDHRSPLRVSLFDQSVNWLPAAGTVFVSAGLFVRGSNLNLLSNCYWSDNKAVGSTAAGLSLSPAGG